MLPHRLPRNLHNLLRSATNRAAQRVITHQLFHKILEGNIGRVVLIHRQLFQNHPALLLQMLRIQQGVTDHIRQHVNRHRHVVVKYARIVAGVFLRGEGV